MQPPPPRYKIFERDGRLITIDTWADKTTPAPPATVARPSRSATDARIPAMLVAVAVPVRDASGRRLLTTGPSWDQKGPRVIALSPQGEQRVGRVLLFGIVALATLLLLAIINIEWMLPFLIIGVALSSAIATVGLPWVARCLDSLGETTAA
ncbi:hypothetical protein J2X47_002343 [Sphingomonas sp. BE270]|uniref:hypothetical protein n=1 Tax=unclassified Sphingomonas TaxID=196159 RepID=UPI0010F871E5|nr:MULTISPECIES: hypothetical protein [unclassified Sphingomonas]MDR6848163.1 hypothetical protein [Sphingomonas sp. BE137]MDR7258157.1 hypothetical protein [Sphingomonas sp. BE270]